MEKLTWSTPATGTVPNARLQGKEVQQYKEKRTDDYHSEIVPVELPAKKEEDTSFSTFELKRADLPNLHSALTWFCGQEEVPIPKVISENGDSVTVRLFGDLLPRPPSSEEVNQIVVAYQLLSPMFPSWSEVIKPVSGYGTLLGHLLYFTARHVEQMREIMIDLGTMEMSKRMKAVNIPELSELEWALKALEARIKAKR